MDTRPVNVLSICSGYGGIELGLHAALGGRTRTVCYVENELGVAAILAARMGDGSLDSAPIWTDLRTFDPGEWRGKVDILAGGFPCQPHSTAGKQLRGADPRELSGEVIRIAAGLGYPTLFLENVPGILRFYWDSIRPELREMGYEVAEGLFTAAETGAPHRRERLFILAHAACNDAWRGGYELEGTPPANQGTGDQRQRLRPDAGDGSNELAHADRDRAVRNQSQHWEGRGIEHDGEELAHAGCLQRPESRGVSPLAGELRTGETNPSTPCGADELAHADHSGHVHEQPGVEPGQRGVDAQRHPASGGGELAHAGLPLYPPGPNDHAGWAYLLSIMPEAQPTFCRDADGAPAGVGDQLRALGNGVVPAVAATAYRELSEMIGGERHGT